MANEDVKKAIRRAGLTLCDYSAICGYSDAAASAFFRNEVPKEYKDKIIDELVRFRKDEDVEFSALKEWRTNAHRGRKLTPEMKEKIERYKAAAYARRIEMEVCYYEQKNREFDRYGE